MHTRYYVLVIVLLLAACSSTSEATQTQPPEPSMPPEPNAAPTELVETELPPSPTPTDPPPATPTLIPTETPLPIQFNIIPYENNPILAKGAEGEWDYYRVLGGQVVISDDLFHMFYTGFGVDIHGIGYAVSSDGLSYTKYATNPILQPDGEGFDAIGTSFASPLVVGDTWMLFYSGSASGEESPSWKVAGKSIGLTTAPGPTGPWTTGQTVLRAGGIGEWDSGQVIPTSVFATEIGYIMYYTGGPDQTQYVKWMCGMATSPDGINWTKYDDPSTTEAPFADSDPVLQPGSASWESEGIHCSVLKTDPGWEMFYEGWGPLVLGVISKIGYASSQDGVHWSKYQGNPILSPQSDPAVVDDDELNHPSVVKDGSNYYLYYSYIFLDAEGVATGTIDKP